MASKFHPKENTDGKSKDETGHTLVRMVLHKWACDKWSNEEG